MVNVKNSSCRAYDARNQHHIAQAYTSAGVVVPWLSVHKRFAFVNTVNSPE